MQKSDRWFSGFLALALASPLAAQLTPTLTGNITDLNGAVIEGVRVTVTGPVGSQEVTTSSGGTYEIGGLVPGTHTLRVEAAGFKTYEAQFTVSGIRIHNVALTPADQGEVIYSVVDSASQRPGSCRGRKSRQALSLLRTGSFPSGVRWLLPNRLFRGR